jgi:hypothetical protein
MVHTPVFLAILGLSIHPFSELELSLTLPLMILDYGWNLLGLLITYHSYTKALLAWLTQGFSNTKPSLLRNW